VRGLIPDREAFAAIVFVTLALIIMFAETPSTIIVASLVLAGGMYFDSVTR